jgi:hypothetical protein
VEKRDMPAEVKLSDAAMAVLQQWVKKQAR